MFLINHPVSRTYVRVSLSCPVCVCVLERACVVHRFVVHVAVVRQDRRYPGRHRHRRGREFRCHRFVAVGLGGNEEQVTKVSIYGALNLYMDFINLFIFLIRMFGVRKD